MGDIHRLPIFQVTLFQNNKKDTFKEVDYLFAHCFLKRGSYSFLFFVKNPNTSNNSQPQFSPSNRTLNYKVRRKYGSYK